MNKGIWKFLNNYWYGFMLLLIVGTMFYDIAFSYILIMMFLFILGYKLNKYIDDDNN